MAYNFERRNCLNSPRRDNGAIQHRDVWYENSSANICSVVMQWQPTVRSASEKLFHPRLVFIFQQSVHCYVIFLLITIYFIFISNNSHFNASLLKKQINHKPLPVKVR